MKPIIDEKLFGEFHTLILERMSSKYDPVILANTILAEATAVIASMNQSDGPLDFDDLVFTRNFMTRYIESIGKDLRNQT